MAIIVSSETKKMKLACVVLMMMSMVMIMSNAPQAQALTCSDVVGYLGSCVVYLRQPGGGGPPPACCSGVAALNKVATTTPERQTACKCLKALAGSLPGVSFAGAAGIPGKCHVPVTYKIDPNTDCSKVV